MRFVFCPRRGQAGIEFVLVVAVVVSIVAGVLLPLFGESEISTALAASRIGILQEASRNGSLLLSSVGYSISGTKVTIAPNVYYRGAKISDTDAMRVSALQKISATFSPSHPPEGASSCVPALYYSYCVS